MTGTPVLLRSDFLLGCSLAVSAAFLCCLIFVGVCFACVAQCKTPGGFWWKNLLCIRLLSLSIRGWKWLKNWLRESCFPRLKDFHKNTRIAVRKNLLWIGILMKKCTDKVGAQRDGIAWEVDKPNQRWS